MQTQRILNVCIGVAFMSLVIPMVVLAGGTIRGTVTFVGEVPPAKKFVFSSFPNSKFCAKHSSTSDEGRRRVVNPIELGEGGGLKGSIVSIRDVKDHAWMKSFSHTSINIDLCDFVPYTGIVVDKKNVHVVNHDADPEDPKSAAGILHTIRAYEVLKPRSLVLFGIGLPTKGSELNKRVKLKMVKRGSIVRLTCDQHEWMRTSLLPVQNPYFKVVNAKGEFEISDVPAGNHTLLAWHPVAGKVERNLTVREGETVEINFSIKRK